MNIPDMATARVYRKRELEYLIKRNEEALTRLEEGTVIYSAYKDNGDYFQEYMDGLTVCEAQGCEPKYMNNYRQAYWICVRCGSVMLHETEGQGD